MYQYSRYDYINNNSNQTCLVYIQSLLPVKAKERK
jgi:hypothetical protein